MGKTRYEAKEEAIHLLYTNTEELVGNVESSLFCTKHETAEFKILRGVSDTNSRITTLNFPRADFGLFRDLLGRIPCETALEGKGAQENWLIIKDNFLKAQEWSMTVCKQSSRHGRRPVWVNVELQTEPKDKKEAHGSWKQGQVIWE